MSDKMFFISKFCLLCLKEDDGKFQDIMKKDENDVSIQEKLDYCVFELVSSGHEFPGFICAECHDLLEVFYCFKQKCFNSNRKIRNFMDSLKQMHFTGISYRDLSVPVKNIQHIISFEAKTKKAMQKKEPMNTIKRSKSQEFPKLNKSTNSMIKDFPKLNKSTSLITEPLKLNKSLNTIQCDMCPKLLANKQTLKIHLLTHSDVRPYECTICLKQFKRKDNLTTHCKKIHKQKNEMKTPKKIMHKAITKKGKKGDIKVGNKIVNREINQNGRTLYQCGICQATILHKHNLKRHFLTYHVDEKDNFDKFEETNENLDDSIDLTDDENLEIISFNDDIIEIKEGKIEEQGADRLTYNEILLTTTNHTNTPKKMQNINHSTPEILINSSLPSIDHKTCNNLECFVCNKAFSRNAKLSAHIKSHFNEV